MENTKEIIAKINDIYILKRKKWVKLNTYGHYSTMRSPKDLQIIDYILDSHLKGYFTVSVFSGMMSTKFVCFDVDDKNDLQARWKVHKLINAMNNFGVHQKYIITSFSGNKGYHVELFFDELMIPSQVKKFYEIIIAHSGLDKTVEFRPTGTQAIKIPLGWNYKNKNRMENECCYVDPFNYFKPFDREYILGIEKIDADIILDIIQNHESCDPKIIDAPFNNSLTSNTESGDVEVSISSNENAQFGSCDKIVDIIAKKEEVGIRAKGTRHNILKDLTILYKRGLNLDQNGTRSRLIKFMEDQDPENYSTPWKNVLKEIDNLVEYAFKNDYQLQRCYRFDDPQFSISDKDIERILDVESKSGKLLLCSMLMHSKQYADDDGVFFMTFEQMIEISTLSYSTCCRQVKNLSDNNYIEIISCNQKITGTYLKKPNYYKLVGFKLCSDRSIKLVGNEDSKVVLLKALSFVGIDILKSKLSKEDFYRVKRNDYL